MDYYQILGINKKSSPDEIKTAYKKLAVKYHPDRHFDINMKKECEEKFKQVSEAYQVLSDFEKKQKYDLFNQIDFDDFQNPSDIFKSIFKSLPSEYIQSYSIFFDKILNSPEVELTNKVFEKYAPENKYFNSIKNIMQFVHQNINNNYNYRHTDDKYTQDKYTDENINQPKEHNEKKNLNSQSKTYEYEDSINQKISNVVKINQDSDINHQNSYFDEEKKKRTDNIVTTIVVTLEEVYKQEFKKVDINRIRKNKEGNFDREKKTFIIPVFQEKIIFKEEADELPNYDLAGDIIIYLKIAKHHLFQRLRNNNLLFNIDVTLYEYYYGTTKNITFLDSSNLHINSGQNLHKSNIKKINSKGLPFDNNKFGDLYIKFNLKLPSIDLNDNKINKTLFNYFNAIIKNDNNKQKENIVQSSYHYFLDTDTCETSISDLSIISSSLEDSNES